MSHVAILSVYDKTGIVDFAKALIGLNFTIVSTGGTAKVLQENNIPVIEISHFTGFPEVLGGRVKTLHPKIYAGILSRRNLINHRNEIKKLDIDYIDLIAVNLYPFEQTITKQPKMDLTDEVIENIDIGGVSLLRAGAKNFEDVIVICDPNDYNTVVTKLTNNILDKRFRAYLATKAFRHTAYYDSTISNYFTACLQEEFPETITLGLKKIQSLRYGENPHQKASLYEIQSSKFKTQNLLQAKQLQGKEMSYNNWLDIDSAWNLVQEFEKTCCVIIKHNNPCGVAEAQTPLAAYKYALSSDPVSAFGGIIAFNCEVDKETAEEIVKLFTECIIAPSYSEEALRIFSTKKNLRILHLSGKFAREKYIYRSISGGILVQENDTLLGLDNLRIVTKNRPTEAEMESLKFAWKVCKHIKSNAIVLARGTQSIGIGAGQMSRIDALKLAATKMNLSTQSQIKTCDYTHSIAQQSVVLASDAFFPFRDAIDEVARLECIKAIIQPGGSLHDDEVITACNEYNIAMVFTGMRHFKH